MNHLQRLAFNDLPFSIRGLLGLVEGEPNMSPQRAAALLSELSVSETMLLPWSDYHHPAVDSYGRRLIARGPNYELMAMSWAPGDFSAIHDHGAAEWGAVRYFGDADHVIFSEDDGVLSIADRMTTRVGTVFPVDHELIHLMGNGTSRPFLSLHLYGRSNASETITGSARVFDLWEEAIQRTDGGVFFCLPDEEITRREPCPKADPDTRLLHHRLMLSRIEAMGDAAPAFFERAPALRRSIAALESPAVREVAL